MMFLPPAAAALLSAWMTRYFCRPDARLRILDHPNTRSLHSQPVPRTGGVAILAAVAAGGFALAWLRPAAALLWLGLGALLVAAVSFADDRSSLHPALRLAAHVAAAALIVFAGYALPDLGLPGLSWHWPAAAGLALSVLFVVWMINLYNFMDGMDGFAAGMAVAGFGGFAMLGIMGGSEVFASASLVVVAAAGGFLLFNFPPARIFMGDTGSALLGFLAAGFSLWGVQERLFPLWAALLLFSPFIVDASVTLLRRAVRGEPFWQAHRMHYYQRLVRLGWGHRKTLGWEGVLFVAVTGSTVWALSRDAGTQWAVLAFWMAGYPLLMWLVARLEARSPARSAHR